MPQVLYILGAGASANVLPTINSITFEGGFVQKGLMAELIDFTTRLATWSHYQHYLELCNEAAAFTTPDTFAKFLYATNRDDDYIKFKRIITSYFFWKEHVEPNKTKCLDSRVISFITTLSDNTGNFPKDVNIISWNYDSQFITAIDNARRTLKSSVFVPNFKNFPIVDDTTVDKVNLNFVHLNGIAGYTYDLDSNRKLDKLANAKESLWFFQKIQNYSQGDIASRIKDVVDLFSTQTESLLISYAWESEFKSTRDYHFANEKLEYARALARGTDILVVIGYSFPFFNRNIDKEIFKEMRTSLNKIYFQDPYLDGKFLYSQFSLDKSSVAVKHIQNVNNYFVPYEL